MTAIDQHADYHYRNTVDSPSEAAQNTFPWLRNLLDDSADTIHFYHSNILTERDCSVVLIVLFLPFVRQKVFNEQYYGEEVDEEKPVFEDGLDDIDEGQ